MPQGSSTSKAYERFHPRVQRWIRRQRWGALRPIQEEAAAPILEGARDVVIAANTAGGKTEAAFLPIASRVAEEWEDENVGALSVLYISPLKALINDQFERLQALFEPLDVPVFRWHGDVSASRKRRARTEGGLLLITPESLEAQFIRRGHEMGAWLAPLRYVVIDELHAFVGGERGRQLQSLLHRVELAARRRVPRVALSATMGDMDMASAFLRPGAGAEAEQIVDADERQTVQLQVRGYEHRPPKAAETASEEDSEEDGKEDSLGGLVEITAHLYEKLRGGRHLVFANKRETVEKCADLLRRRCEEAGVPNEFWAHHGSLGRSLREEAEARLQAGNKPTSIVATTTLELGIDVGSIETIAQVGPPPSVASMRQRLGRSGRKKDAPAVLRVYVQEKEITAESAVLDRLRARLVRSVAMVRLLARGWNEPPQAGGLHLSTLVQQVLSLIAQRGGLRAEQGYEALCARGPFRNVTEAQFAQVLRDLGRADLITQTHDGALMLDLKGERLVDHYEFYAAFMTPEEFRLVAKGRSLGSLPIVAPLYEGRYLIFGGQRWKVLSVDEQGKVVQLAPAAGGRSPSFDGGGGALLHKAIRHEMRAVYEETGRPRFLGPDGQRLLEQGRRAFSEKYLAERVLFADGPHVEWFPWTGDRAVNALALELRQRDVNVKQRGLLLQVRNASTGAVRSLLESIAEEGLSGLLPLARQVQNKQREEHHPYLRDDLLAADYASLHLDREGAQQALLDSLS